MSVFLPFEQDGWRGLIAEGFTLPSVEAFLAEGGQTLLVESPCRTVAHHSLGRTSPVYAKLMRAQNDTAFQKREFWAHWKWANGPSRAIHILHVSAEMLRDGFHCPEPLLAVRKREPNGWHKNLLVTAEVLAPTLEKSLDNTNDESEREALVREAAKALFQFHAKGYVHGDFLPRNCCLDRVTGQFFFLDNDKTFHWRHLRPFWMLRKRNLEQFAYNLMRREGFQECHDSLARAFLEEYGALSGKSINRAYQNALSRWQHHRHSK